MTRSHNSTRGSATQRASSGTVSAARNSSRGSQWLGRMHEMTTREAIRHGVVNPTLRKPGTSQPRIYTAEDDDDYALARDLDRALRGTGDVLHMDDDDKAEADELDDCALDDAEFRVLSSLGSRVAELSTATFALKRQSSGDSESWSEVASEWSVVSAAESAWMTVADEPVPTPLVPTRTRSWGTTADDAAFARKLQMEEWDSLLPARPSMNASSAFARKSRLTWHQRHRAGRQWRPLRCGSSARRVVCAWYAARRSLSLHGSHVATWRCARRATIRSLPTNAITASCAALKATQCTCCVRVTLAVRGAPRRRGWRRQRRRRQRWRRQHVRRMTSSTSCSAQG